MGCSVYAFLFASLPLSIPFLLEFVRSEQKCFRKVVKRDKKSITGATHGGYGTNTFLKHFCPERTNSKRKGVERGKEGEEESINGATHAGT